MSTRYFHCSGKIRTITIKDLPKVENFTDAKKGLFSNFLPKLSVDTNLFQATKIMANYRPSWLLAVEIAKIIDKLDVKTIINVTINSSLENPSSSKTTTPSPKSSTAR